MIEESPPSAMPMDLRRRENDVGSEAYLPTALVLRLCSRATSPWRSCPEIVPTAVVITIEPTHRTHSARRNRGRPVKLQPRSLDRSLQSVPRGCELQLSGGHP